MKFRELASVGIWPNRFVVISEVNGKISIAQKIYILDQDQKPFSIFLKNAILCTPEKALEIAQKITEVVGSVSEGQKSASTVSK